MSKSDSYELDILKFGLQGVAIADLAATVTVALHTADPGEAGTQLTNETTYPGYARVSVARTTGGFSATTGSGATPASSSPIANIDFPASTGVSGNITHFSIGTGTANRIMYKGTVAPPIVIVNGTIPRLTTASTITED